MVHHSKHPCALTAFHTPTGACWLSMQGSYRTGGAGRPRRLPSVEIPGVLYRSIMRTKLCPSQSLDEPASDGVSLCPGCSSTCAALTHTA